MCTLANHHRNEALADAGTVAGEKPQCSDRAHHRRGREQAGEAGAQAARLQATTTLPLHATIRSQAPRTVGHHAPATRRVAPAGVAHAPLDPRRRPEHLAVA
jgi:hypothetical protein